MSLLHRIMPFVVLSSALAVAQSPAATTQKTNKSAATSDTNIIERFLDFAIFGDCESNKPQQKGERAACRIRTCQALLDEKSVLLSDVAKARRKISDIKEPLTVESLRQAEQDGRAFEEKLAEALPVSQLEYASEVATKCEQEALNSLDEARRRVQASAAVLQLKVSAEMRTRDEYKRDTALTEHMNRTSKEDADKFEELVKSYNGLVDRYNKLLADYTRAAGAYNNLLAITRTYLESQRSKTTPIVFPTHQPAPPPMHCSAFTLGGTTSINCR